VQENWFQSIKKIVATFFQGIYLPKFLSGCTGSQFYTIQPEKLKICKNLQFSNKKHEKGR